jgi:hypothetical protein
MIAARAMSSSSGEQFGRIGWCTIEAADRANYRLDRGFASTSID